MFESNAVLTKSRALYAKRITENQYGELMKKNSIDEVINYLRDETVCGDVLQDASSSMHREELEMLLQSGLVKRLIKLMRYSSKKDLPFYNLAIFDEELGIVVSKIKLIKSGSSSDLKFNIPQRYTQVNLDLLNSINTYDDLLKVVKNRPYYSILLKHQEDLNVNQIQNEFKKLYRDQYYNLIKHYSKKRKQEFLTVLDTSIELDNITKIYRMKRFFKASPEEIYSSLYLRDTRLSSKLMMQLANASSAEDVLKQLEESSYHLYVGDHEYVFIEYYADKIKYNLAKRYMRFSTDPQLVFLTYNILQKIELENLIHVIEGIRYGQSAESIETMLIY